MAALDKVFELIAPVALIAHEWSLGDAETLTRGLALVRRDPDPIDQILMSFEP